MSKPRINRPLPVPMEEYDRQNEAVTRRTIEQRFDEVEQDIDQNKTGSSASASLALRKYQFLLMGAS